MRAMLSLTKSSSRIKDETCLDLRPYWAHNCGFYSRTSVKFERKTIFINRQPVSLLRLLRLLLRLFLPARLGFLHGLRNQFEPIARLEIGNFERIPFINKKKVLRWPNGTRWLEKFKVTLIATHSTPPLLICKRVILIANPSSRLKKLISFQMQEQQSSGNRL